MGSRGSSIVVSLLMVLVATDRARAFVPSGFTWRSLPMLYDVNTSSARELGRDAALAAVEASYASWAEPLCSGFRATLARETTSAHNASDGRNTIVWMYDAASRPPELGGASTLGITLSVYSAGAALDVDILMNGIDHRWSATPTPGPGQTDAQAVLTHETGHQLGLSHSPFVSATMYGWYGGVGDRSLATDDIEGVCALYPSGAMPECTRDAECGADRVCRGGACVPIPPETARRLGDPCASPDECFSGHLCIDFEGDSFCTRRCADDCPVPWTCEPVTLGGMPASICLPEGASGMGVFGDPCDSGSVCSSGLCVVLDDVLGAICSSSCIDDATCPSGAECAALVGGGGACVPAPPEMDAGPPDAGPEDAGEEPDLGVEDAAVQEDAGIDDAGEEPVDAGEMPIDLGARDAGRDAGAARRDAGNTRRDAGRAPDAAPEMDAGVSTPSNDDGCGCVAAGARSRESVRPYTFVGLGLLLLLALARRRARRRAR